jgi:hypothetical protein
MIMAKKDSKIADNPSIQEMSNLIPFVKLVKLSTGMMKAVGLKDENIESIHETAAEALRQADLLNLPDQFNNAFAENGWIFTGSMSVDVMREALDHHADGDYAAAEETILTWFSEDNINFFVINRSKSFNKATKRRAQLQEALTLTSEERYMAAIPLILIACDGFASEILGTSPFEKDADLTSFASIIGHPTSLPALVQKLVKGVRKSSDEELTLPLRHGILHGRSLGYANRLVCYKAWMLMIALVDWAFDKRDEEERRNKQFERESFGLKAFVEGRSKLIQDRKIMDEFQTIEWDSPSEERLSAESPVFAFKEFLEAWKMKNFGTMAKRAVNITHTPIRKLAGSIRNDAGLVDLIEYELRSVRQSTVARAEARVFLHGRALSNDVKGEFEILAFWYTPNDEIAMPADQGYWKIQSYCIFDLMNEKTIES